MDYPLISPRNGAELRPQGPHLLTDGETAWPTVDGIPYLRDREEVRVPAVAALRRGDVRAARRLLLADQDRFSPTPPPVRPALDRLADEPGLSLRTAMELLNYGAVGDYFAYRWCSPTFTGGLYMLECTPPDRPVIEVACGIGHYLRALEMTGRSTAGIDIVWSKLWLARRFLAVRGPLVCADIEAAAPLRTAEPHTVFCHDAFYFFERKEDALQNLRALSAGGSVAVGHVHTRASHHAAGFALSREEYAALTDAPVYDDERYILGWYGADNAPRDPHPPIAVGWIEGESAHSSTDWCDPARGVALRDNPLFGEGRLHWPSAGWAAEYAEDSRGLQDYAVPRLLDRSLPADRDTRFRHRYQINLPELW